MKKGLEQAVADILELKEERQELIKESLDKTREIKGRDRKIKELESEKDIAELETKNDLLKSLFYELLNKL